MKSQWPAILYHAVILECEGSPTTVGMYVTEQAALDRLEVARKQIVCDTPEPIWLYVLTVKGGEVTERKDIPVVTESQRNEVYATA